MNAVKRVFTKINYQATRRRIIGNARLATHESITAAALSIANYGSDSGTPGLFLNPIQLPMPTRLVYGSMSKTEFAELSR